MVPLTAPALLVLDTLLAGQRLSFFDGLGFVLLYAVFGFGAMAVPGLPLPVLCARPRWTGFLAFIAGGTVCAAVTYVLVVRGQAQPGQFALFSAFGIVEG